MKPITNDTMLFIAEMATRRIKMVAQRYIEANGENISPKDFEILSIAKKLHARMESGDYRMSEDERTKLILAANVLSSMHAELEGTDQKEFTDYGLVGSQAFRHEPLPKGSYRKMVSAIAAGELG